MAPKKLLQRVGEAVPRGEGLITAFESEPALDPPSKKKPIAPDAHRPQVFEGMTTPSDSWGIVLSVLAKIVTAEISPSAAPVFSDPTQRDACKRENRAFYGGWTSQAGQLLAALQPRSKTGVISLLAVTGQGIRVVYVQRRRGSMYRLRDGTQLGWTYPIGEFSWVRQRAGKNLEFGFPDGSWATVVVHTNDDLQKYFPNLLPITASTP